MNARAEITVETQLAEDVRLELEFSRHKDSDARQDRLRLDDPKFEFRIEPTIRLGEDFLDEPLILKTKVTPKCNKTLRTRLENRVWSVIQVAIEELTAYFSRKELEDYDPQTFFMHPQLDSITSATNCDIRKALWFAFLTGRSDGREEGQRVMKALLGECPCSSKVYKMENSTGLLPTGNTRDVMSLKIKVETPGQRDQKHHSMLFMYCKALKSVECGLENVVESRVKLVIHDFQESPREIQRNLARHLNYLENQAWNCATSAYNIGRFDGFELGQNSIKDAYKDLGCHMDGKIHSFAATSYEDGISVDLDSAGACGCGQCWKCMSSNTSRFENDWVGNFQTAKEGIARVESDFDEERARKRRRTSH